MTAGSSQTWVCLVCGYVHRGPEPPDVCPVCGTSVDDFEAQEEAAAVAPRCREFVALPHLRVRPYRTGAPPTYARCAGASADDFEPCEESAPAAGTETKAGKVIVVGGGIAGLAAVESVRSSAPDAEILLISKEDALPYYRLNLTRLLAGQIGARDLPIYPAGWYKTNAIQVRQGVSVKAILPDRQAVELDEGTQESYDKLILTCGAHAFVPPLPGADMEGVHCLRTDRDAESILAAAKEGAPAVIIGGGILGLETAAALAQRGVEVTVLEGHGWLLPRQLNQEAGEVLERHVAELGIRLERGAKTAALIGDDRVRGVLLSDDKTLAADLVVIATGVRANSHLARSAGLDVNRGVVVDPHLATSHPDILAAGDVAEFRGTCYGLWEPARYQGAIAGMNAAGVTTEFGGLPRANTLKVVGVSLFSIGEVVPQDGSYRAVDETADDGQYRRFLFRDNRLVGAVLIGNTKLASRITSAVKEGKDFSGILRPKCMPAHVVEALTGNA